ncbi:MAG: hypothetical protein K2Q01_08585 [Rickettsiales bacterium]|nr:hypothetical protein [Rickettsiales bacterium]
MTNGSESNKSGKKTFNQVIWWAYLVTAVLAIPSLGFLITQTLPVSGAIELVVFIIACWFCTYMGMRLMSNPKFAPPSTKDDQF